MKRLAAIFLVLAMGILPGCSEPAAPPPSYNAQEARSVLTGALDAWKAGEVNQLSRQTPPIGLMDDDLVMGAALVSYDLSADAQFGPHQDVLVQLVLRDRRGRALTKQAVYQVSLEPKRTVFRNDP